MSLFHAGSNEGTKKGRSLNRGAWLFFFLIGQDGSTGFVYL